MLGRQPERVLPVQHRDAVPAAVKRGAVGRDCQCGLAECCIQLHVACGAELGNGRVVRVADDQAPVPRPVGAHESVGVAEHDAVIHGFKASGIEPPEDGVSRARRQVPPGFPPKKKEKGMGYTNSPTGRQFPAKIAVSRPAPEGTPGASLRWRPRARCGDRW